MHFISEDLENYVTNHSQAEPELLAKLNKETHQKILQPRMLSGHFQGRVLSMLSKIIRPKNILEIGTFTGFSTLCLAEGLIENGQIHTIEIRDEDANAANTYFKQSPHATKIYLHVGDAKEIIPTLSPTWDLIFIDADKTGYIDYYNLVLPRLAKNGLIIVDNVLFHGDVLEENISGKSAKAIQAFNEHIQKDETTEHTILTIRDGLTLIRKK